ncbi:MAG: ATP phosphoribosyltransferase regulatory subunit, partial [Lachnospiraceae bacterium]|nr:ATP phosphoribosyltransferase regulatory subunit [Lachnospiraceae bacterium]
IERLKQVYDLLKVYGVDRYISFDLAMVSKYNYYTGVIFNAYTYQAGSAIAKGGRYDSLLEKFGKPAPATGFVVMIDDLVTALTRQKVCPALENKNLLLLYAKDFSGAAASARKYREQGYSTVLMKLEQPEEQYTKFAEDNNFSKVIIL